MIVETRRGERFLIHNKRCIDKFGGFDFCTLDDDLTDIDDNEGWDIVKVYKSKALSILGIFNDNNLELIWERDEDTIKVGDRVEVVDKGLSLSTYTDWVERNVKESYLRYSYDIDQCIDDEVCYEVLYIAKHGGLINSNDTLAYIENLETNRCYLINVEGLKKVD